MEQAFSAATRAAALDAMAAGTVDVLVIGGGITGAGVARDAAMRGLRTALVDAGDWAAGTSSQSSRLIHGGLRYLEHGWFHLVFEASRERRVLLRTAPHLVRPRAFVFPAFRSGRVKRWEISAAVLLYDMLALFRNAQNHRWLSRDGVLRVEPLLRDQDLTGGAVYWDAQTDDARLALAVARAAQRHGALCASYSRVTALEKAGGRVRGAELTDALTGRRTTVRAHTVVNATGPWTDRVRRLDDPAAAALLRPTKGVHIVVPQARLGNTGAVTLTSPLDGRVMFVLPWGDTSYVGTTDTDTDEPPDTVRATADDVTYLLRSANAVFPNARLGIDDVVAAWAGLRPLLKGGGAAAGSVPREHHIEESASGLISIAGGKLTTFRVMAQQVADLAARRLHALDGRRLPPRAATDSEPLPGGEAADFLQFADQLVEEGLAADTAQHLAGAYGTEAAAVMNLARAEPALGAPLVEGGHWIGAEIVHQARREMVLSVGDVVMRRLHLFHRRRDHGEPAFAAVAGLLQRELRWSDAEAAASVEACRAEIARLEAGFRPAV